MNTTVISGNIKQLLIRWVFVVVPTVVIAYVTLLYVNSSFTSFNTSVINQTLFFASGLLMAYSLYFFRARWIVTFILLWIAYWLSDRIITRLPGEFDVFYATAKFQLYSTVFIFGWVFGFLLVRVKYSYIILFGILAVATMVAISNTIDISFRYILLHVVPILAYGLYMLFLSPLMTDNPDMDLKKSGRLLLRFGLFLLLVLFAFILVERFFKDDLKAVEKELVDRGAKSKDGDKDKKEGGYDERHGLMEKPGGTGDDGYRLKDTMKIDSKMSQSEVLMFCSNLKSFYPDGSPKPLYFVYHYLTKYDPVKETFTRDRGVPYYDEFDADPSTISMFHSREDTTIIRNSLASKMRNVVEAEVYLSSNTWKHSLLAPASAFYCQTIPVEKDFQKTYFSAYRVRSYASELNNAYFVYNPSASPMLEAIQEQRHDELRTVRDYNRVDEAFFDYYTKLPSGVLYDSIARLTQSLVPKNARPVDKVLAVRDFFLQRDPDGKRVFRYTLKPGAVTDPNIPSASMLGDFLFKTQAGYCTYYAGASLFMLRSMGIPSRFTTGFATVNRNDKNKGWYWFYASQAHAWTQVYFPGYGWMDFDMTIGNEDQQTAPRPDGTPPLPPPDPWLVLNSRAETTPNDKKHLDVSFQDIVYFDEEHHLKKPVVREVDASNARVLYDKKDTTLSCVTAGDSIIVVSYKNDVRPIPRPRPGVPIDVQVAGFPSPIVADEIHVKPKDAIAKKEDAKKNQRERDGLGISWQQILYVTGGLLAAVVIALFLLPLIYLFYLLFRSKTASDPAMKADRIYQSALYQFHMAGVERENETPLDYARQRIDPVFMAGFEPFMHIYLRLKYGTGAMLEGDKEAILKFGAVFGSAVRRTKGFFRVALNYFNPLLASRYFMRPQGNEIENQPPAI